MRHVLPTILLLTLQVGATYAAEPARSDLIFKNLTQLQLEHNRYARTHDAYEFYVGAVRGTPEKSDLRKVYLYCFTSLINGVPFDLWTPREFRYPQ